MDELHKECEETLKEYRKDHMRKFFEKYEKSDPNPDSYEIDLTNLTVVKNPDALKRAKRKETVTTYNCDEGQKIMERMKGIIGERGKKDMVKSGKNIMERKKGIIGKRGKKDMVKSAVAGKNVAMFSCEKCPRRFKFEHHLVRHQGTHTGEKPFQCEICKNRYSRQDNLTRHKRLHTVKKPFACEICKERFSRSDHLKRHATIHKEERPGIEATEDQGPGPSREQRPGPSREQRPGPSREQRPDRQTQPQRRRKSGIKALAEIRKYQSSKRAQNAVLPDDEDDDL